MPNLVFRFPFGRFHATPWGNHVNEGLVEWPPSPWRVVRALLSTGFTKLGWTDAPAAAHELVQGLSSALPTYRLPSATAAHTRHFMPTDSPDPEKRTKVLDGFARVGPGSELAVLWPVELTPAASSLLEQLVPKISYLGRAESIVDARLASDGDLPQGLIAAATTDNRPGLEPITLLAPMTNEDYGAWLASAAPSVEAPKRGKRAPESPYPSNSFDAIIRDTAFLQRHGWTQPPGSYRVLYYRPVESLSTAPPRNASLPRMLPRADTALLALSSDTRNGEVLPSLFRCLPQADLLHRGLLARVGDALCPELSGRAGDGSPLVGHQHARILPLCLAKRGQLDHFLLHAPMGLGAEAQHALRSIRRTYVKGGEKPLFLTLAGMGEIDTFFRDLAVPELAQASVWTSRTPFVPPRHVKAKRHTVEDQVQAELASAGLPVARRIDVLGRDVVLKREFHRFVRARRDREPPASRFFAIRIELERPVQGPVALGYGSHFGLGLMTPETQ